MKNLQIIEQHILIRDTCGYDVISKVDVFDMPQILQFLLICQNYKKMQYINDINDEKRN